MKKIILFFLFLFSLIIPNFVIGQSNQDKVKSEISKTLERFYKAAQEGNAEGIMSLFDSTSKVMFVGGDSAEIWEGTTKIRAHLNAMFPDEKVTLLMNRTDIDYNQNTAWVFADGQIVITLPTGDPIRGLYRFSAILVKLENTWKFRLYNGSNPGSK